MWKSSFVSSLRILALGLFCLGSQAFPQFQPASAPTADQNDKRFDEVQEDLTSPTLTKSHLLAVAPLSAGVVDHPGYTEEMVRLQWRFADPIDVFVLIPKGKKNPPVSLYLYGHSSDIDRFREASWQEGATRDGFAAVGFVSALTGQRYHDLPLKQWFVSELPSSLAISAHDVQMILKYLASRKDLDTERVSMLAQGSGASIAILAAAVDPRIKVLDLVDPWGDWPVWLANSPIVPENERQEYVAPEFLARLKGLDPVDWFPRVTAKLRLQEALFATSTPSEVKDKIRASAPAGATIVIYKTPQETADIQKGNKALEWMHSEAADPKVQALR